MRGSHRASKSLLANRGPIPAYAGEPVKSRPQFADGRAYPRVCGGAAPALNFRTIHLGLSPRMRGSPQCAIANTPRRGPIPAYAGEPTRTGPSPLNDRAYPRVCGGARPFLPYSFTISGLSPRMRGSHARQSAGAQRKGPIPAYAGEPTSSTPPATGFGAYPRVCGGADDVAADPSVVLGLSPRMRGSRM